jgi:hypothetical protein
VANSPTATSRAVVVAVLAVNVAVLAAGAGIAAQHGPARRSPAAVARHTAGSPAGRGPAGGRGPAHRRGAPPARRDARFRAGATVTVADPRAGIRVRVTAGVPRFSTTRLSPDYGYPPERGVYVSFAIRIHETGRRPLLVQVLDFVVDDGGLHGVTVDDGAAPFSGAPRQLDNTLLSPGQTVAGTLTFDVPARHGTLRWLQAGRVVCAWTF